MSHEQDAATAEHGTAEHGTGALLAAGAGPASADSAPETAGVARGHPRRRRLLVYLARAATLVVVVGGWQLLTAWKVVDPFFFGQPSGIAASAVTARAQNSACGPTVE